MTTIEFNDTAVDTSVTPTRTGWLGRWFAAWKHKRARRMTLIALSQMDERLLHDIGIEPMDVEQRALRTAELSPVQSHWPGWTELNRGGMEGVRRRPLHWLSAGFGAWGWPHAPSYLLTPRQA